MLALTRQPCLTRVPKRTANLVKAAAELRAAHAFEIRAAVTIRFAGKIALAGCVRAEVATSADTRPGCGKRCRGREQYDGHRKQKKYGKGEEFPLYRVIKQARLR